MQLKTILNRVQKHRSFVYGAARLLEEGENLVLEVDVHPRANGQPTCSRCGHQRPGYDLSITHKFGATTPNSAELSTARIH